VLGEDALAARGGELSTVAERYAGALFDLARAEGEIEAVERNLDKFHELVRESADLRRLVLSPVFSSREQQDGLAAVMEKTGIAGLVYNFLLLLSKNRRLFAAENVIKAYKALASRARGEVEAQVVSSIALSEEQRQELVDTLRQMLGKTPKLAVLVDAKLLGGLVIRVGSQMIDTSLRTKLKNLEKAMKEAS
jgi:F-type H+-transporting ATPase subunit delta